MRQQVIKVQWPNNNRNMQDIICRQRTCNKCDKHVAKITFFGERITLHRCYNVAWLHSNAWVTFAVHVESRDVCSYDVAHLWCRSAVSKSCSRRKSWRKAKYSRVLYFNYWLRRARCEDKCYGSCSLHVHCTEHAVMFTEGVMFTAYK